jgi:hypothetical protein
LLVVAVVALLLTLEPVVAAPAAAMGEAILATVA